MSSAAEPIDPDRLVRALARLRAHCELVGRLTAVDDRTTSARIRLERALGPGLTKALLAGLTSSS